MLFTPKHHGKFGGLSSALPYEQCVLTYEIGDALNFCEGSGNHGYVAEEHLREVFRECLVEIAFCEYVNANYATTLVVTKARFRSGIVQVSL